MQPLKGWQAWQLMELLQDKEMTDGRWEKTEDGYRLTGISKVAPARAATTDDPQASNYLGTLIVIGAVALLAVSGGLILVSVRRSRRSAAVQPAGQ